jgi:purine-binding chemotaxis protein CheW
MVSAQMKAQKLPAIAIAQEAIQYLTFLLDDEMFAINILHIKEIIEYGQITTVPLMPEYIRGVINLRGAVVPVVDLSARFSGHSTELTRRTCVVIIEVETDEGARDIGVMVDAVSAVLEIPDTDIEPAPSFGTHMRVDFIKGMGKVNGKFVIILNVNNVLMAGGMAVQEAGTTAAACEE